MRVVIIFLLIFQVLQNNGQTVGINTNTPDPAFKLDVNGTATTAGLRTIGANNFVSIFDQSNNNNYFRWNANANISKFSFNTVTPVFNKDIFVIQSDGKVGIGTSNPTTWFDVSNTTAGGFQLGRFNGGDNMWVAFAENGINRGYIGSYAGNSEDFEMGTYSGSTGRLILSTINVPRLQIDNTGNVCIGASPLPSFKFDVIGGDVRFRNDASNMNLYLRSNSTRSIFFRNNSDVNEAAIKSTGQNLYLGRGNVFTDLTIDEDGDVGIGGEILPVSQLQVMGGYEVNYTNHGHLMLGQESLTNMILDQNEILARNNGSEADLFIQHDGGNLLLCGLEGGAVGIGLTAGASIPVGSLLAVDGKITCEEVLVKLSQNWPDYVFADNYKLPKISEIKTFIEENKHLPGIPKASEIEKNGLNLGDMQRLMLEKIEELTLYIIDLKKENDEIKKELTNLKRQ